MLGLIVHWDHKLKINRDWLRYLFQLYDYPARAYNVDKMVFVDVTGTLTALNSAHTVVDTLEEALQEFPTNLSRFHLTANGQHNIMDFTHPTDELFIIGPDYNGFEVLDLTSLYIPMANSEMELWANQAVSIALAHRFNQSWQ